MRERGLRGAQSDERNVCARWGGQLGVHALSGLRNYPHKRPSAHLIVWDGRALQELRNDVTFI